MVTTSPTASPFSLVTTFKRTNVVVTCVETALGVDLYAPAASSSDLAGGVPLLASAWRQGAYEQKILLYKSCSEYAPRRYRCPGGRWLMGTWAVARCINLGTNFLEAKATSKRTHPFLGLNAETDFCDLYDESIPLNVSKKHRLLYAKSERFGWYIPLTPPPSLLILQYL